MNRILYLPYTVCVNHVSRDVLCYETEFHRHFSINRTLLVQGIVHGDYPDLESGPSGDISF